MDTKKTPLWMFDRKSTAASGLLSVFVDSGGQMVENDRPIEQGIQPLFHNPQALLFLLPVKFHSPIEVRWL